MFFDKFKKIINNVSTSKANFLFTTNTFLANEGLPTAVTTSGRALPSAKSFRDNLSNNLSLTSLVKY